MIPFLFPELTEDRFIENHRAIIASIDRERDWIICNSACTKADVCGMTAMSSDRVFVTPFAAAPDIFHPEPDPERIASLAERPRERHRVVLTGFVPDEDLSAFTAAPRSSCSRPSTRVSDCLR